MGFLKGNKLAYLRKNIGGACAPGYSGLRAHGHIPWNKGKHHLQGENHPMYGKHHTPEALRKMSKWWFKKGQKPPHETYKNLIPYQSGENHWNWKGGISSFNERQRKTNKYKEWRKLIFKRDNYTCQHCHQYGGKLQADHIKPFSLYPDLRFETDNGRTLCENCHRQTDTFGGRVLFL